MIQDFQERMDKLPLEKQKELADAIEAHAQRLMNTTYDPPKPAPNGFAHWPSQPHGAGDVMTPHLMVSDEKPMTIGEYHSTMKERAADQEKNPLVIHL